MSKVKSLNTILEALEARASNHLKDQSKEISTEVEKVASGSVLQLPIWGDDRRGLPNEIVRSSLFNARNRNIQRQYLRAVEIAVIGDGSITYTGDELRQDDETVYM